MQTPNQPSEPYTPRHLDPTAAENLGELAMATARGRGEAIEATAGQIARRVNANEYQAHSDALAFLDLLRRQPSNEPGYTLLPDLRVADHPQQAFDRAETIVHQGSPPVPAQRQPEQQLRRTGSRPR